MVRIFKFTRIIFALMFALSVIGFSASVALAAPPNNYNWTNNWSFTDDTTCGFTIYITSIGSVHEIDLYDQNGNLTNSLWHVIEQDTFTANGKSLVGLPYHFTWFLVPDKSVGIVEKVPLPNGSLFISAGMVIWSNHSGGFTLFPDRGALGNIDSFCAALAP